jgi:hypothetical protein
MSSAVLFSYPSCGIFEPFDSNAVSDEARRIRILFNETRERLLSSPSLGSSREECRNRLIDAYNEATTDGWDGYGASEVKPSAIHIACIFIDSLPTNIPMPDVSVEPDGEISFDWISGARRQFSISLGERKVMSYAGLFGSDKVAGSERFQGLLPRILLEHIRRVAQ